MDCIRKQLWVLLVITFLILALPISVSAAMEHSVTNEDELRNKISNAGDGDTIVIKNDINIIGFAIEINGKSITIKSEMGEAYTINQNASSVQRHFSISDGSGLTLENIIIDGANTRGGISVSGTLTVGTGAVIQNCYISNIGGAGIRAEIGSKVTITNGAVIQNCKSLTGSGIYASGATVIVSNGAKIQNCLTESGIGGGIYAQSSIVTIDGAIIENCETELYGGGIAATKCIIMVRNGGKVENNTARDDGGGIWVVECTIILENNGKINDNTAGNRGGGIYALECTITMEDGSEVNNNKAKQEGGGIYARKNCTIMMESSSEVRVNTAGYHGGGIYAKEKCTIIMGNAVKANNNIAKHDGGGIYAENTEVQIKNGAQINNNLANGNGGGVHISEQMSKFLFEAEAEINGNISELHGGGIYASLVLSEIKIYGNVVNNEATYDGGGIYSSIATVIMGDASTLDFNKAFSGGGIYNYDGNLTVSGTVTNNIAEYGGGIYNHSNYLESELSLENGSIVEGNSACEGGGIYNHESKVTASGIIKNNTASYGGGGIYNYGYNFILGKDSLAIISGIVEDNEAYLGGGIYNCLGTLTLETDSIVDNNTATFRGGGIYEYGGNTTIYGIVSNNTAKFGVAGGIYAQTGKMVTIDGGSIINNKAAEQGGGAYLIGYSMLAAKNEAIFSGNISEKNSNVYLGGGAICTEDMTYSNLDIDSTVKFSGNMAQNFYSYTGQPDVTDYIRTASSSKASYHPLNNWDINYLSYPVTIKYQTNTGGSVSGKKDEVIYVAPGDSYEHTGTDVKGYKFIEWKLNGEKQEGVIPGVDGVNDDNNIIVLVYKKVSTGGSTSPEEAVDNDSDTSSTGDTSDDDNNNEKVEEDKEDEDKKDENKKNTENNDNVNDSDTDNSNTDDDNTAYYDENNYVIFDYETIIIDPVLPLGPWELNSTNHFAYMIGYADGAVKPQGNITREEAATIFFRLLEEDTRMELLSRTNNFSDVDESRWSNVAISTLSSAGIIKGYEDGTFRPSEKITRAEFASIASRFDTTYISTVLVYPDTTEHWAKYEISRSTALGWIRGNPDGKFYPNMYITRAEAATFVNRMLLRLVENENDLHSDMTKWQDNSDTNAWYYLAIQEATNSHDYDRKFEGSLYEVWYGIIEGPDWAQYER